MILDDRSRNGVHVNGERVSEADLRDGDTILCGRVTLRFVDAPSNRSTRRTGGFGPPRPDVS